MAAAPQTPPRPGAESRIAAYKSRVYAINRDFQARCENQTMAITETEGRPIL
jgi:hypothetical protein